MTPARLAEIMNVRDNLSCVVVYPHLERTEAAFNDLLTALDAHRAAVEVLGAECCWWKASEHLRKNEPHNEFARLADARAATRNNSLASAAVQKARSGA